MAVKPKVHFVMTPGGLAVLFSGPVGPTQKVAMGDECCCDKRVVRPGYIIRARDCCSGEKLDIFLKLDNPPVWAFTKTFGTPLADPKFCFKFDPADVFSEAEEWAGGYSPYDFLADPSIYSRHNGCNECRCASDLVKCCYNYLDYPTAPAGGRTGQKHYEFSGLTAKAGLFACRSYTAVVPGAIDPITGGDLWVRTEAFTPPNGIYGDPDECSGLTFPSTWGPITTKYYLDPDCNDAANVADQVSTATLSLDLVDLGIFVPRTGILGGALWRSEYLDAASAFDGCNDLVLSNFVNSDDAGEDVGTLTVRACCPDEDGGI